MWLFYSHNLVGLATPMSLRSLRLLHLRASWSRHSLRLASYHLLEHLLPMAVNLISWKNAFLRRSKAPCYSQVWLHSLKSQVQLRSCQMSDSWYSQDWSRRSRAARRPRRATMNSSHFSDGVDTDKPERHWSVNGHQHGCANGSSR